MRSTAKQVRLHLFWGRVEIGWDFHIHRYDTCGDRWIFQPFMIWDRK